MTNYKKLTWAFIFLRSFCSASELFLPKTKIRFANLNDISLIKKCNVDNLPENYSDLFFQDHLTKWPELSLICVDDNNECAGYALGKVEKNIPERLEDQHIKYRGHITSIAVYERFRGHRIAFNMMSKLHNQFLSFYGVDEVSLHCRVSNEPAVKLYGEKFDYQHSERLSGYYEDGEDAWLMKLSGLRRMNINNMDKILPNKMASSDVVSSSEGLGFVSSKSSERVRLE